MTLFGRTPAMWLAALTAVLAVVTAIPQLHVSGELAAWIVSVASALFAVLEAVMIRPVTVAMLTGVVRTGVAALLLFNVAVPDALANAIVAAISVLFGLLVHANGTPAADPAPGFNTASRITAS